MKKFFILLLFSLSFNNAYALSIVYDGFECTEDSIASGTPAQSRFLVDQDLGNGHYKLLLKGGYLVFKDKVCLEVINNTTHDPENFYGLSQIEAIAYFNGNQLAISYGSIIRNKDIVRGDPILLSDISFPSTYTLVFDYLPSKQTFTLKSVTKLDNLFLS
ncbi:hypothetical protein [Nitrosomonas sp.]|uniref:hypothetical protein n=1 Tax=Nitrosomonas sp. TaxID=42353 RepID=UPI001DC4A316|nr:hypothetical protein [Nitrosomonas sp.]MBX3617833.1 hypothetical protein [Nitrosomonas sp.]